MHFIYVDEAGTSAKEPVTVVVGVIVHADRHWRHAAATVELLKALHVPPEVDAGAVFHAKRIFSGFKASAARWPLAARLQYIGNVAALPRQLGMAISIGKCRRDAPTPVLSQGLKPFELHHQLAFKHCIARANKFVREEGGPLEVATVVAEDSPSMRAILKKAMRTPIAEIPLTTELLRPTLQEQASGVITQTNSGPIDRVVDVPHFVEKQDAPLLQIADACAFSFRRYFAQQSGGEQLVQAMLGGPLIWEDWQGPSSEMVFRFSYPDGAFHVVDDLPVGVKK